MAESQCVASQWDRSGSIVCSFDSLPTIRFCLTLTRHNCANCLPGFWLWASFKIRILWIFQRMTEIENGNDTYCFSVDEWMCVKMWFEIGQMSILDCTLCKAVQCNASQCNAQGLNISCYHQRYLHCLTRVVQLSHHFEICWIRCHWKCNYETFYTQLTIRSGQI